MNMKQEQEQKQITLVKMVFVNEEISDELSNVHVSPNRKNAENVLLEAYNTITLFASGDDLKITYRPEYLFLLVDKGNIKCLWAEEGFIDTMVEMCGATSGEEIEDEE